MSKRIVSAMASAFALLLSVVTSCSSDNPAGESLGGTGGGAGAVVTPAAGTPNTPGPGGGGSGGVAPVAGAPGAGNPSVGGQPGSSGSGGVGGLGTSGSAGASGSPGTAGQGGQGGAVVGGSAGQPGGLGGMNAQAGSAGAAGNAGMAGTAGASAGGGGGAPSTGTPSAGCGKSGRPAGVVMMDNAIITFPTAYDGSTPMPLVFGFHGAGRTNTQFRETDARTRDSDLEKTFVMAYLKSAGNEWTNADLNTNIQRFTTLHANLLSTYCIDTKRVFATGHSSGAGFTTELVCRQGDKFRGVAPVAAWNIGGNCPGKPALIIHGSMDKERGNNGSEYVMQYVNRAGCMTQTAAFDAGTCMSGGQSVDPGCKQYQGCGANPVIWCSHNDPNYNNTNHGWPCFANKAILDFFSSLK